MPNMMAMSPFRALGLAVCCGQVLFLLVKQQYTQSDGDGVSYFGKNSLAQLAGFTSERRDWIQGLHGGETSRYPRLVKKAASVALAKLHNDTSATTHEQPSAFETAFSTHQAVLQKGFPLTWTPCTLQPLLTTTNKLPSRRPLEIVVLGGSSSAHAAKNCSHAGTSFTETTSDEARNTRAAGVSSVDPYAGRYSNILMHQLLDDFFFMDPNDELGNDNADDGLDSPALLEFNVVNMAQGATDSFWNALMLDELIDTNHNVVDVDGKNSTFGDVAHHHVGADIIIVEYGINDALGGSTKLPLRTDQQLAQMMNVWLWRVYSLFRQQQQHLSSPSPPSKATPPPVLFLYLWDANFYQKDGSGAWKINSDQILEHGIGQTSWKAQRQVIEHYRNHFGWSIGAINVGAVINQTVVAHNPSVLLDDKHHPNCDTMHLITAMIRQTIHSDLANCPMTPTFVARSFRPLDRKEQADDTTRDSIAKSKNVQPMELGSQTSDEHNLSSALLRTLLDDNIKVGSIMEWEPNVGSSSLSLGLDSDYFLKNNTVTHTNLSHIQADFGSKSYPGRADRKQSFTLSPCDSTDERPVRFTLFEPTLEWLGIGYHMNRQKNSKQDQQMDEKSTESDSITVIEMTINDVPVLLTDDEDRMYQQKHIMLDFDKAKIVREWVRLVDYIAWPPPPQYTLAFCYKSINIKTLKKDLEESDTSSQPCPYERATSMKQVCDLWELENFDSSITCPYANLETVSQVCFQWYDTQLSGLEAENASNNQPQSTQHQKNENFVAPQLNWLVGVIRT